MNIDLTASIQMEPNKWYRLSSPEAEECCDCGLVHVTEYQLYKGMLMFKSRTDKRATAAARKRHGIKITKAN